MKKEKQSVVILVWNNKNELALQLRSAHDTSYPLHWDFSAAGGIEDGEDHLQAAIRELKEEIGIESELIFVREIVYEDEKVRDILFLYKTHYEGSFKPDASEVEKVEFFSLDKIESMLKTEKKFHPEFSFLWKQGLIR